MKIKSFKVKRPFVNSTLFALFIFLAALIIHSCKKDNNQKSALAPPAIDAARAWYESNYPAPVSGKFSSLNATTVLVNGLLNYSSLVKPDWQHGASYTRYSTGVVELPIDPTSPKIASDFKNKATGKIIYKKEYSRSSFLLLYDGIKYKAYIMTIIADSAYLKNDLSKLALTTYRKRDPNFTGAVFYFTPTGSFVSSYGYKNGVLIPPAVQTATTLSASNKIARNLNLHGSKVLESAPPPTPVCLDWYYDTYEDGELISEQYLYTTCQSPEDTNGSGGSSNPAPCTPPAAPPEEEESIRFTPDQVTPPPTPVGGGDGDGGLPPPDPAPVQCAVLQTITNNLKNPCANQVLDDLLNDNLTGQIAGIIQNVFGSSANVNLDFEENNSTQGNSPAQSAIPSITTNNGIITYNETITLNSTQISSASHEYLASLMIHEILHAYLNYNNTYYQNQFLQHQTIAQNYITSIRDLLQQEFDIDNDDANSLILAGMSDLQQTSYYNSLVQSLNLTPSAIQANSLLEKEGIDGTPCVN